MSDWESIYEDSICPVSDEEALENFLEENYPDDEEIKDQYFRIDFFNKCMKVIDNYNLVDYFVKHDEWSKLSQTDVLNYCKQLLEPLPIDDFPLLRQVSVFTKLVNIDISFTVNNWKYREILEAAFYDDKYEAVIKVNCFIPQKHYKSYIQNIYNKSNIKSLNIPEEKATEYLQELLEIWFMHKSGVSNYTIAKDIMPYDSSKYQYEEKQIKRKIFAIKKLIK